MHVSVKFLLDPNYSGPSVTSLFDNHVGEFVSFVLSSSNYQSNINKYTQNILKENNKKTIGDEMYKKLEAKLSELTTYGEGVTILDIYKQCLPSFVPRFTKSEHRILFQAFYEPCFSTHCTESLSKLEIESFDSLLHSDGLVITSRVDHFNKLYSTASDVMKIYLEKYEAYCACLNFMRYENDGEAELMRITNTEMDSVGLDSLPIIEELTSKLKTTMLTRYVSDLVLQLKKLHHSSINQGIVNIVSNKNNCIILLNKIVHSAVLEDVLAAELRTQWLAANKKFDRINNNINLSEKLLSLAETNNSSNKYYAVYPASSSLLSNLKHADEKLIQLTKATYVYKLGHEIPISQTKDRKRINIYNTKDVEEPVTGIFDILIIPGSRYRFFVITDRDGNILKCLKNNYAVVF